jgi:hypothetical protein
MAEQQELRVILRTVAQTQGAQQTSAALKQVERDAQNIGGGFRVSAADAARFAGALAGVNVGLSLFTEAGSQIRGVIAGASQALVESERVARANAAAYGANAQQFERLAVSLRETAGISQQATLQAALSARTLSANYGLTIEQTQKLIRVSADLANVRGIQLPEAFERVQSAIRGEAEASEFLGLTLNDTFIKNNALNGSVRTTFERMTDAQKAQIRYTELLRQTAQFQGLASQSVNSLEGAQRKATVASEQFSKALGGLLAPSLRDVAVAQADSTRELTRWLEQFAKVPTAQEMRERQAAIGAGLPQIGPQPVAPVTSGLIGAVPGQTNAEALRKSLEQRGIIQAAEAAARQRREERARDAADQRRLRDVNELPRQTVAQSLKEVAFLDQRDAAIRDIVASQREELDIRREITRLQGEEARATQGLLADRQEVARLERDIANQGDRRVAAAIEARRVLAEQRAAPAQNALADTQRTLERARLVAGDLSQSAEARSAAIREAIQLQLRTLPRQRLEAFDAESGVLATEREQRANQLATRAANIPLEGRRAELLEGLEGREGALLGVQHSIERQENLANVVAATTQQHQQNLEQIIGQAIRDGLVQQPRQPIQFTIQVLNPDGSVSYEELIEAEDQATFPPVIQVSGVRRRP